MAWSTFYRTPKRFISHDGRFFHDRRRDGESDEEHAHCQIRQEPSQAHRDKYRYIGKIGSVPERGTLSSVHRLGPSARDTLGVPHRERGSQGSDRSRCANIRGWSGLIYRCVHVECRRDAEGSQWSWRSWSCALWRRRMRSFHTHLNLYEELIIFILYSTSFPLEIRFRSSNVRFRTWNTLLWLTVYIPRHDQSLTYSFMWIIDTSRYLNLKIFPSSSSFLFLLSIGQLSLVVVWCLQRRYSPHYLPSLWSYR